jgi:hypothetical protein
MEDHPFPDQFQLEGWRGQLQRVERWYLRAIQALDSGTPRDEVVDFLYAFFQAADNLWDWLIRSGSTTAAELNQFVTGSEPLRFSREICNGSKHFALDGRHRTSRIRIMQELVPPKPGSTAAGIRLRLFAFQQRDGGVEYRDIDDLMDGTMLAWRSFCSALH